ncbi:15892_t:CDS:2 [Funneliformis geosporum]|uniref:15892_t:CDS:1 n=1 Tax=Funneliformis geosporum TaxID=1117311 RepID=A0A9W4SS56_9GLOM|nr:15892_t:CDS:2 [Funneliformis geosporum]
MLLEIINFFLSPLSYLFEPYFSRTFNAFTSRKTQRTAVKSIFVFLLVVILVSIAFLAYLGFYMIYVPKIAHVKPIYLQYENDKPPYAIIDFTDNGRYDTLLTADQAYDVSIDLYVPNSDRNIALGNFMIGLGLRAKNETVQFSSRPCILTYQSGMLRVFSTLWRLIPLVLGFTKEDQKLKIVMLENMIESEEKPITEALITISNSHLEVYNAQIRLDAHFRGLRSFVSWWQNKVIAIQNAPITSGGEGETNNTTDSNQGDDSDRTWLEGGRRDDTVERNPDDNETSDSEYESSRPGSVISPTGIALVYESGDNTESYVTDDDDSHSYSTVSRTNDNDHTVTTESEDQFEDDDQTEGSATPTSRSRRSTISAGASTNANDSEFEERPSLQSRSPIRRTGSNIGNLE